MAQTYIGKPISLISHSDVRYRGILAGIDPEASTIQLSNVYSMGTESRRPHDSFIPPVATPYSYIIFRASEVKELAVDEQEQPKEPKRNVYDDPAVMQSAPLAPPPAPVANAQPVQAQPQQSFAQAPPPPQQSYPNHAPRGEHREGRGGHRGGGRRGGGGGGRGGHTQVQPITVPTDDFDFETANARFAKTAPPPPPTNPVAVAEELEPGQLREDAASPQAYDKKKSFFDTLSPGPATVATNEHNATQPGGRGRGGRGRGRARRDDEREKNLSTFGEAGGIGLMGPGAYVGGWGGYGRRGGGRRGQRGGQTNAARG